MTRTPILLTLIAAAALAGCERSDQTIVQQEGVADPMANVVANAGPVDLPPSIVASKTYRCSDNSLVYIDWLEKNGQPTGANFRSERTGSPTPLSGAEGKPPFTAEGYSLTGTKDAASITLERPGKGSQSCKA